MPIEEEEIILIIHVVRVLVWHGSTRGGEGIVYTATNTHCLHKRLYRKTDFIVNTTK